VQVEFYGAARQVTGSCHIVRVNGKTILLDCGLFRGKRADVQRKNEHIPVDVSDIDAVVLSHAHIDLAGRSEPKSWIDAVRRTSPSLENVWLVHGEPDAQDAFFATLELSGYRVH
jgi:Cft2 family RNA processing exonuclease